MADSDIDQLAAAAPAEAAKVGFSDWAGGDRRMLALVFTDIVDSTTLAVAIGDPAMKEVRVAHFARSSGLIAANDGYEIKTIGDSVMATFHLAEDAFNYARSLCEEPGHDRLGARVRAGIHVGPMEIAKGDAFGVTVNYAARVIHAVEGPDIGASADALSGLAACFGQEAIKRDWDDGRPVAMKGFETAGKVHLYAPGGAGADREKFPRPAGFAKPARAKPSASPPEEDFLPEPYDLEDVALVDGEVWIERREGAETCPVLGQFQLVRRAYLRTKRGVELIVSPARAFVATSKSGPGALALPEDVLRGRTRPRAEPAPLPGGRSDDCVRFSVNPPPGQDLGGQALPKIGSDNELEELATATPEVETERLAVEVSVPLKAEGLRVRRKDRARLTEATLEDLKAVMAILVRKGQAARGDGFARYRFNAKDRRRGG